MAQSAEKQEQIAGRIKQLRENAALTQPELAAEIGVSLRAYQWWEKARGISPRNYRRLAEVFGVSVEYLLHGPDVEPLPAPAEPSAPASQLDRIEQTLDEIRDRLDHIEADAMGRSEELAALRDALRGAGNGGTVRRRRSTDR